MKRFKNILLALDPELQQLGALVQGITLARQNRARLRLIVVLKHLPLEDLPLGTHALVRILDGEGLREMIEQRQHKLIEHQLRSLTADDLDVTATVQWSHVPFVTIIQEVLRHDHDLLIKTAKPQRGPAAALFHPTDRHLIRKCPCPVWMVRTEQHLAYGRILAAVDPFHSDAVNDSLNRQILELATSQALRDEAELHVAHAFHLRTELLRPHDIDLAAYRRAVEGMHRERLEALLDEFPMPAHRVHMEEGRPSDVIGLLAIAEQVDLIVMGSLARVGIPGVFMGTTAERILDQVHCDVLTVKPEGFVTPIPPPH